MQHPGPHGSGHQQHRSMSHYAASTIPPMSSAMSSSKSGGGSRVKMEGRPDQGGNGVTGGSGKKKSSNKRKGAAGSSVMPEEAQVVVATHRCPLVRTCSRHIICKAPQQRLPFIHKGATVTSSPSMAEGIITPKFMR